MTNSSQKGLVSTIIPVFNRPEMVVKAVESVLQQSYRPIEIIIVDDGSIDSTPQVIAKLNQLYQEVTVLSQKNSGPGVARELGRQHARGEFIQYLDSDDILLEEKFTLQVTALNDQKACDVAYCKTDRRSLDSISKKKAWKSTGIKVDTMFPTFLRHRWWGTSTPLYRRSVTEKAGPWLPTINEEDWEYDCRIASLGGKLAYVDEFLSIQYMHDNHLSSLGTVDLIKLRDRCLAREHMYQSVLRSAIEVPKHDMEFFAKSVFLLGRQCAERNLDECVSRMLLLANKARGAKSLKQSVFTLIGTVFGWPMAARITRLLNR